MRDKRLRLALTQCQCRRRLALSAIDDFQEVLLAASGPLRICDFVQLTGMLDGIRQILGSDPHDGGMTND
jgi:hypothetical protein